MNRESDNAKAGNLKGHVCSLLYYFLHNISNLESTIDFHLLYNGACIEYIDDLHWLSRSVLVIAILAASLCTR